MKMSSKPCRAKVSASPMVAVVMPTAPASSCSRAISTHLWVFTCGRSATPGGGRALRDVADVVAEPLRGRRAGTASPARACRHVTRTLHPPVATLGSMARPHRLVRRGGGPRGRRAAAACSGEPQEVSPDLELRACRHQRRPRPRPTSPPVDGRDPNRPPSREVLASDGRPRRAESDHPEARSAGPGRRAVPRQDRRRSRHRDPEPRPRRQPVRPAGGVGPGGVGNYQVTAHRVSSTQGLRVPAPAAARRRGRRRGRAAPLCLPDRRPPARRRSARRGPCASNGPPYRESPASNPPAP